MSRIVKYVGASSRSVARRSIIAAFCCGVISALLSAAASVKSMDDCGVIFVDGASYTGKRCGRFSASALYKFGASQHKHLVALRSDEFIWDHAVSKADF